MSSWWLLLLCGHLLAVIILRKPWNVGYQWMYRDSLYWTYCEYITDSVFLKKSWNTVCVDLLGNQQRKAVFMFLSVCSKIFAEKQSLQKLEQLLAEVNMALAVLERDMPVTIQVAHFWNVMLLCAWKHVVDFTNLLLLMLLYRSSLYTFLDTLLKEWN